ncbi:hypothetical protein B0T24DRAFT_596092 [Lasiosphaeria ovina]|uniref:Apple domain-containing protein n=1 Tax=Lasiosphaeria ovina TaxID=92902 RepID=A0AAE0K3H1_9PEZI|nr:hypothetical protein B0T24DRAFT_596092 [Lasiosphaeria ovina]
MGIFRLLPTVAALAVSLLSLHAPVASAQSWSSDSTSYHYESTCLTGYGSPGATPLPTAYERFPETTTSVAPLVTVDVTDYVTADTTTAFVTTTWLDIYVTTTVTVVATSTTTTGTTFATLTTTTTVCAGAGTGSAATPASTATVYTGTYDPAPGQNTTLPATFPTTVSCVIHDTELVFVWPTAVGTNTVTSTYTPSTAAETSTITNTYTRTLYAYAPSTVIKTATSYAVADKTATATVDCGAAAIPTVTYAARCAPQNLLAEAGGHGLDVTNFNAAFVFGGTSELAPGDPSRCCQLCVDNAAAGCVASVYWAQSSSCLLGYVGGPETCPVAFDYSAPDYILPRLGNIVQTSGGCGSIKFVPAP